jgi:hypothetical protein
MVPLLNRWDAIFWAEGGALGFEAGATMLAAGASCSASGAPVDRISKMNQPNMAASTTTMPAIRNLGIRSGGGSGGSISAGGDSS